jgi:hypothetical protein
MSSNKKRLSARLFLLKEMVVRDIRARYAGSGLGIFWAFANPVLWTLLYTGVFGVILRVPVEKGFSGFPEFPLAAAAWMAIRRCRSAGPDGQRGHGQETVFPVETPVLSVVQPRSSTRSSRSLSSPFARAWPPGCPGCCCGSGALLRPR